MLPAIIDTAAELSGERQGESSTPRQSHCHVGGLASSAADIIGRLADGRRRHPGGCGSASRRQPVRATHVHMRCPCGCPWHAWVGLQEKRRASPPPRPAQRRRVAYDAACPSTILQGTVQDSAGSDGKRPDGVSLIPWSRGRCVTWDVTSPDTLAPSPLPSSATQAGSAAARAEAAKTLKYSALAITHVFVPLAFETLGAWGVEAAAFVAELGRRMMAATGDPRETLCLRQRLSVAIQRGNAIACRGHNAGGGRTKLTFNF